MRLGHRFVFRSSPEALAELAALGVEVEASTEQLVPVEMDVDDPRWPLAATWLDYREESCSPYTKYDKDDLDHATWMNIRATSLQGYPQPESDGGYERISFSDADGCKQCRQGYVQVAPIRMKGEPKWGRRSLMQLNWLYDIIFVKPETWKSVFKDFGIDYMEVHNKRGETLSGVVQLVLPVNFDLSSTRMNLIDCAACERQRHEGSIWGPKPAVVGVDNPDQLIGYSHQYFGAGWVSSRSRLIHQDVRQAMLQHNVIGAVLEPTCSVEDEHRYLLSNTIWR